MAADASIRPRGHWDRSSATLALTYPTRIGLRSNSGLRGENPVTNRHRYGTGPAVSNKKVDAQNYGDGVELSPAAFSCEVACDLYILTQHTTYVKVLLL